jgi:hypothetical protein
MDFKAFKNQVKSLTEHVAAEKGHITSEADVRRSLVLPLFNCLSYNVHSASEVKAEFPVPIGSNKEARADLVIMRDGKPCIVVECKMGDINDSNYKKQLKSYFQNLPDSKFGVLTNGVRYQFYCDQNQSNVMEDEPFFEFDISAELKEDEIEILRNFHKAVFDINTAVDIARDQMCSTKIKSRILQEMASPSEDFVRCVAHDFIKPFRGSNAQKQMEQLQSSTKKAFAMAMKEHQSKKTSAPSIVQTGVTIVEETVTDNEIECYHTIQALLGINGICEPSRLFLLNRKNHVSVCTPLFFSM